MVKKTARTNAEEYSNMARVGELEIIEFFIEESISADDEKKPAATTLADESVPLEAEGNQIAPQEGQADNASVKTDATEPESVPSSIEAASVVLDSSNTVKLGYFGVNVAKVLEVIESPALTPSIAASHPSFMGTIPLREKILPVLDLSVWLGLKRKKTAHEVILVTEFHDSITGFLVSGVTQIYRVPWSNVEAPNRYLSMQKSNCITGMVKIEDYFVLMLDFESIIAELDPTYNTMFTDEQEVAAEGSPVYRAIVAEDSSYMRNAMSNVLRKANFETEMAVNGEDAWHKIIEIKNRALSEGKHFNDLIDVIITDIEMPKMDGYSLVSLIKEDHDLKDTPVILFSSIVSKEVRHKGEKVGADDQISKPEIVMLGRRAIQLISDRKAAKKV